MGKRAVIITTVPRTRIENRVRRATKDDLRGQGIDAAIETYLATSSSSDSSTPKR